MSRPDRLPAEESLGLAMEDIAMHLIASTSRDKERGTVFAVTSSAQSEGKSVLAVGLARWLASAGKRVVAIDADMRRPSVLKKLASPRSVDATDGPEWAPVLPLHVEARTGLSVLALGEVEADPVQMLSGMAQLTERLRDTFEFVVIDTPPLLAVGDALSVLPHADRTLFVVQWGQSRRRSVQFALDRISPADRERTRLVFSQVRRRSYRRYEAPGAERYARFARQRYAALSVSGAGAPWTAAANAARKKTATTTSHDGHAAG